MVFLMHLLSLFMTQLLSAPLGTLWGSLVRSLSMANMPSVTGTKAKLFSVQVLCTIHSCL